MVTFFGNKMAFADTLKIGKIGESKIALWFQGRGYNVLPVYEKQINEGKGPVLFTSTSENLICPDMLVFKGSKVFWIEAKHKTAFSWHRKTERWVTGIDKRHYQDYLKVAENLCGWPVYLIFLHEQGIAKDTPAGMESPTGLFGEDLNYLKKHINHTHDNWGRTGMVYWWIGDLKKYCELNDLTQ